MAEDDSGVLEAVRALGDKVDKRMQAVEGAVGALAERIGALERTTDGIDRKVNAVARRLLAPAELMALGIQSPSSGGAPGAPDPSGLTRAAKPTDT